jgi:hypothetical protein
MRHAKTKYERIREQLQVFLLLSESNGMNADESRRLPHDGSHLDLLNVFPQITKLLRSLPLQGKAHPAGSRKLLSQPFFPKRVMRARSCSSTCLRQGLARAVVEPAGRGRRQAQRRIFLIYRRISEPRHCGIAER